MTDKTVRGVIRGRTIELERDAGFAEGQTVQVIVRSIESVREVKAPRSRDVSPLSEAEWDEWEAIMKEIQQARKIERCATPGEGCPFFRQE